MTTPDVDPEEIVRTEQVRQPVAHARITEVTVSILPEGNINYHLYTVTVQWRGGEDYAVVRLGECLHTNGKRWDYEPSPSARTDRWKKYHRFDYDTAYAHALRLAPDVVVNGRSAREAAARLYLGADHGA